MRIILVTSRFPMPAWRGNQIRSCEWIEALQNHDLQLHCPAGGVAFPAAFDCQPKCYRVGPLARVKGLLSAVFSGRPLQEGLYDTGEARRSLADLLDQQPCDLVIVQMLRCGWARDVMNRKAPGVPWIFDAIDSMGLHFEQSPLRERWLLRPVVGVETTRCRKREQQLAGDASLVTAVARRDLEAIGAGRGKLVPVAGRFFEGHKVRPEYPTVLLSGNLGYLPTVRGAEFFANEVWAELQSRVPGIRWVLAGARPDARIRRLATRPGIEVHADVEDMNVFLGGASVAIAPMTTGSGIPMKILEAWAAGVPVVAHPLAAAGLEGGQTPGVALATTAEQWVREVDRLLADSAAAETLTERGRAIWNEYYAPSRVRDSILEAVETTMVPASIS